MLFGRSAARLWLAALSTWGGGAPARRPAGNPDAVRLAMRELLASLAPRPLPLVRAVAKAPDVATLWHLRGPLMQALSAAHGELRARQQLARVDALFLEAWPAAPVSRWQELR